MKFAANVEETTHPVASAGGPAVDPVRTGGGTGLPCRLVDPEMFFAESPADVEYAKALCRECPVQQACLTGALARHEPWGVWGGQLFVQGAVVARKRPRGRPRKHPLPEPAADPRLAPAARRSVPGGPQRTEEAERKEEAA